MTRLLPLYLFIVLTLAGCSKAAVYRNLYEGIRTQSELQNLHENSRQEKTPKSYDQYRLERQEQLADDKEEENR
jgi:hypothetical protein